MGGFVSVGDSKLVKDHTFMVLVFALLQPGQQVRNYRVLVIAKSATDWVQQSGYFCVPVMV